MSLPRISGRDCVKVLQKRGYLFVRQTGSHIIIRRTDPFSQITVPDHKELDRGTLRSIIRQANMTTDEFNSLLSCQAPNSPIQNKTRRFGDFSISLSKPLAEV